MVSGMPVSNRVSHVPQMASILPPLHFFSGPLQPRAKPVLQFLCQGPTPSLFRGLSCYWYLYTSLLDHSHNCLLQDHPHCQFGIGKKDLGGHHSPTAFTLPQMSSQISEHRAPLCLLCHSIDGAQLHVMFPCKSFLVFRLIAWVTIPTPCSHLSHSMILALMAATVDVCAWGFCLLQYLCSLRYVDTLLPLSDTDIHGPDKLQISLPVVLASCWYPVPSIISVTIVPTRS